MPLPIILGIGAAIAAVAGVGSGIDGAAKMKHASDQMKEVEDRHKKNCDYFEAKNKKTTEDMDLLGKTELEILNSFEKFSNIMKLIQGKPRFKEYSKDGVLIPEYDPEKLEKVSVGAGILLGGIGGAAAGTAGGFAAAGATTAAVMALGTASTGTAIASLSGVAATNATLAVLGGGAIAAGGGGVALGTTILGASTLGIGLLVGGIIFNIAGRSLSEKSDQAKEQMLEAEKEIKKICDYLTRLDYAARTYHRVLVRVDKIYQKYLEKLEDLVCIQQKTFWQAYTANEKRIVENTVLLVNLLYQMNKVQLVLKTEEENALNTVNEEEIRKSKENAEQVLVTNGWAVI